MENSLNENQTRLVVICSPGEARVALLAPKLTDYAVWHPAFPDRVGDIYLGHVADIRPDLGGRFVALPDGLGFLPDAGCETRAGKGDRVVVRVTRAAQGGADGKGVRLTARLTEAEAAAYARADGPARRLAAGPDPVARLAATHPAAVIEVDEAGLAARLSASLPGRVRLVRRAMEPSLAEVLARLEAPVWYLPGGARLHVTPTPALTAIDVDMGQAGGANGKAVAQARFNAALLPELARQIRLRNLGGAILVDFAGMPARRRPDLAVGLRAALADDPLGARLAGFTALGFAEIVRRRVHAPLHEVLAGAPARLAAGTRQALAAARPGVVPVLALAPTLMACFDTDAAVRRALDGVARVVLDAAVGEAGWMVRMEAGR